MEIKCHFNPGLETFATLMFCATYVLKTKQTEKNFVRT